jgi:hypothetical protein
VTAETEQTIAFWKDIMKYNDDIQIDYFTSATRSLGADQWFALMVVDQNVADGRPRVFDDRRTFWEEKTGRLALEQTSGGQVYISKDYNQRNNLERGETCVVTVANPALCYELRG